MTGSQYVIEMLGATLLERDQQLTAARQRIALLERELVAARTPPTEDPGDS